MTYASGYLFATGIGVHKIYKISLTGEVSVFAGTGIPGSTDGTADVAQFNRPNGIATNARQDRLYISDYATESVRKISSSQLTGIKDPLSPPASPIGAYASHPNPASKATTLFYTLRKNSLIRIHLYSSDGRLVRHLLSERQASGAHQFLFETPNLTPGIYYCKLWGDGYAKTLKLTILH